MSEARVARGMRAGFWAATTLIAWFVFVDVVRGQPLLTPAYLSGLLFSFTTALPASARLLAFAAFVFVTYGLVGALVALLMNRLALAPRWYLGVTIGLLTGLLAHAGSVALYRVNLARSLGWLPLAGNVVAGVVLMTYLKMKRARS
jgi:hypothetical protein